MSSTRNNQVLSSPDSSRPRKKHIHAECGEPIKGHHRVNGALVCRGTDAHELVLKSKTGAGNSSVNTALSHLQPQGTLDDLEFAMEHSLQLLREAKARGFSSRGIPGTLRDDSSLQRRGANANPSWAAVAISAVDTFRDLWKYTLLIAVGVLCIFSYLTRNDSRKPNVTCIP